MSNLIPLSHCGHLWTNKTNVLSQRLRWKWILYFPKQGHQLRAGKLWIFRKQNKNTEPLVNFPFTSERTLGKGWIALMCLSASLMGILLDLSPWTRSLFFINSWKIFISVRGHQLWDTRPYSQFPPEFVVISSRLERICNFILRRINQESWFEILSSTMEQCRNIKPNEHRCCKIHLHGRNCFLLSNMEEMATGI